MDKPIQERVESCLRAAIEEFNSFQPAERQLRNSPETALIGADGVLDSLALVSFLVGVEQEIATEFNTPVTLASDKAFSMRNSPFASVGSLAQYVRGLIEEAVNA